MLQYRLVYFNIRGRGEVIRLLFAYSGQQYDDVKVEFDQWPKLKPTTPVGKLPILEIRDTSSNLITRLTQSRAIGRYLANTFNIAGNGDLERAKADEIVDQVNDEIDTFGRVHRIKEKEKRREEFIRLTSEITPVNLKYFESILSNSQNGYLVGDGLTWADLALMSKWDSLPDKATVLKSFPLAKKHDERIRSIPRVSEYLKRRSNTKL